MGDIEVQKWTLCLLEASLIGMHVVGNIVMLERSYEVRVYTWTKAGYFFLTSNCPFQLHVSRLIPSDRAFWFRLQLMVYFRIDLEDRNYFVDIAEKIEQNTAPILRPSKLIKVGQPQPSILLLASKMHEKV